MHNTLYIVDDNMPVPELPSNVITFETYLREYPKANEGRIRVINLCDTTRYLSQGYYCSLLGAARNHEVLPTVHLINSLRDSANLGIWLPIDKVDTAEFADKPKREIIICLGQSDQAAFAKVAQIIFERYSAPLLSATLSLEADGLLIQLNRIGVAELSAEQAAFFWSVIEQSVTFRWHKKSSKKKFRWDMALLVDPQEASPPSNKSAISRFVKAGAKLGINVEVLTAAQMQHVNQYDAVFIRETTSINHHTYRFACDAEKHGVVVMDDPDSILRCCNKVFLHDAFSYQNVPSLKTLFISKADSQSVELLETELNYPMVLKLPEGSFSKGVFKVADRPTLIERLESLFVDSALVLAQRYLYTEFDWRIGVLNGRALYACRYYMARNHWQIYNHKQNRTFSGDFDTLPTFEVPKIVLEAALKSAAVVGNGLYGVDIKVADNKAYVIEVNDNPNIDHGIEDNYLGEELYMQIMSEFLRRLEQRGSQ